MSFSVILRSVTARPFLLLPLIFAVLLPSCGVVGSLAKGKKEAEDQPFGPTGIPPELRARRSATVEGGQAIIPGGNVAPIPAPADMTPASEIIFTDPDNPTALPELAAVLTAPAKGPWEESETIAKRRAAREGKPLLIWFTDSARSPLCRALSQELFATPAFNKWADEKIIRLRVDASAQASRDLGLDDKETRRIDLRNYVTRLKKQYKVLGHPSVIMLNPSGEVIGRYRGFQRGQADYFWGLIKHGEAVSATAHRSWRQNLEKKGYREWSDPRGRKVFAKLLSYSNGNLVLIEPDGTRSRTKETSLSREDQGWIAQQKMLRNLN